MRPDRKRSPHPALHEVEKRRGWVLPEATRVELWEHLRRAEVANVVELGSGASTRVFAEYAHETGAKVTSFEHDPTFALRTVRGLGSFRRDVDLRTARLVASPPVYQTQVPPWDFALIDGPPTGLGGRARTLPWLLQEALPGWEAWLDDGDRSEEAEMASRWTYEHQLEFAFDALPHGLFRFSKTPFDRSVDMSGITLTILTGARPHLLDETLWHLPPNFIRSADRVVILNNGNDQPTNDMIDHFFDGYDVEPVRLDTPKMLPMGEAMGILIDHVESDLWFHLEDDWRYATTHDGWLDDARRALDDPDVFQVRCRHSSETVLPHHMASRARIRWQPHESGVVAASVHMTSNPTLMRTVDARPLWPSTGEPGSQQIALDLGLEKVVQLFPGAFHHTGARDSLREITGG